jgi:lysophospholipase L1-like esterase
MLYWLFRFSTIAAALSTIAGGVGSANSADMVIVAFGDSTTALRPTVPKVYAQILQDTLPGVLGKSVQVYNAGVGGNQTYNALGRLDADVRNRHPQTVIVQFGINDSWVYSGVQGDPSEVPIDAAAQVGHPRASYGNYTANLTGIITALKGDGARVILMTPNQLQTTGPGAEMPWRNDRLATYAQAVRGVAAAENVELLDVWKMYSDYTAVPGHSITDLLVDSQHPGQLGHQMVADRLTAMIVPEPGALALLISAGFGLLTYLWRRRPS